MLESRRPGWPAQAAGDGCIGDMYQQHIRRRHYGRRYCSSPVFFAARRGRAASASKSPRRSAAVEDRRPDDRPTGGQAGAPPTSAGGGAPKAVAGLVRHCRATRLHTEGEPRWKADGTGATPGKRRPSWVWKTSQQPPPSEEGQWRWKRTDGQTLIGVGRAPSLGAGSMHLWARARCMCSCLFTGLLLPLGSARLSTVLVDVARRLLCVGKETPARGSDDDSGCPSRSRPAVLQLKDAAVLGWRAGWWCA